MKLNYIKKSLLTIATILCTSQNAYASVHEKLDFLEKSFDGRIGLYAINTANQQSIEHRAVERFPFQSTFKVIAVAAILKKSETDENLLQQKMTYTKEDLIFWSPITEKHVEDGMTIFDLCAAAIMYSDNTAANLIMKALGGPEAVTAFAHSIGDNTFRVDNWEPNLNSDASNVQDTSTPEAMEKSLQKLTVQNSLAPSQQNQLITWMKGNTTGDARIRAGVPKGWIVADKTGSGDFGIVNDIGLIWAPNCAPIIVTLYTINNKKDAARRDDVVAESTRIVIDEFAKTDSCLKQHYSSI